MHGLFDDDGNRITETSSAFPADTSVDEWIPEADDTLAPLLAAAMLTMYNVEQVHTSMKTWDRGHYQQGQQVVAEQSTPITVTSGKRFILKSVYDAATGMTEILLGDYLQLPRRGKLTPQQNQQYIDSEVKRQTWTWRDPAGHDFSDDGAGGSTALADNINYNDVDLSAIVGSQQSIVNMIVECEDGVASSYILVRPNGNVNAYADAHIRTQVANVRNYSIFDVVTDSAGKIEIKCVPKPTDWSRIHIVIRGYKPA